MHTLFWGPARALVFALMDIPKGGRKGKVDAKLDSPSPPRKMTDAMIARDFEALLFSLGVPQASREQMIKDLSTKQKWAYLSQHEAQAKEAKKKGGRGVTHTPQFFVAALQEK